MHSPFKITQKFILNIQTGGTVYRRNCFRNPEENLIASISKYP